MTKRTQEIHQIFQNIQCGHEYFESQLWRHELCEGTIALCRNLIKQFEKSSSWDTDREWSLDWSWDYTDTPSICWACIFDWFDWAISQNTNTNISLYWEEGVLIEKFFFQKGLSILINIMIYLEISFIIKFSKYAGILDSSLKWNYRKTTK